VKDTFAPTLVRGFPRVTNVPASSDKNVTILVNDLPEPEVVKAQIDYGTSTSYGSTITSGQGYWRRHTFTLSSLAPNTVYHYRFTLTDPVGNVTKTQDFTFSTGSGSATTITSQPSGITVAAGQTATFSVATSGTAPSGYQWYRDGVALDGATGASYTTPPTLSADNNAVFSVVVYSGFGNVISNDAVLKINTPPAIASGPTATPNPGAVGQPVSFIASATDAEGDTVSYVWNFGDGATGGGASASHTYNAAGTFTVTLTASDGVSASTAQFNLVVNDDGGDGGVRPVDSDGDGVGDAQEIADGTDPLNPLSFKTLPMAVLKLSGSVKFSTATADSVSVSGTIMGLPAGFTPKGLALDLNVGGARVSFTLDAKGRAKNDHGTFSMTLKGKRDAATKTIVFAGGDAPFKARLLHGTWSGDWTDEGVTSTDVSKSPMMLLVTIGLDGKLYGTSASVLYSSKKGKGAFK
jgi:hypothetical protein